ncbi:MAG: molybdopterin-guanine dinucleotide biosynthesis protein B [Armatimonadetes bacterium]|nr:molybdopterin-guanine dinucleotide biosynthesis protein B [Armatimonadota bacterium]
MVPTFSVIGKKNSGKTTFIEKLVPELMRRGLRVGVLKHDVHGFEMDHEGKDTWRHTQAGACTVAIAGPGKMAVLKNLEEEMPLEAVVERFYWDVDMVVTEGYKRAGRYKIEITRTDILISEPSELMAVISDLPLEVEVPRYSPEDVAGVADFLLDNMNM